MLRVSKPNYLVDLFLRYAPICSPNILFTILKWLRVGILILDIYNGHKNIKYLSARKYLILFTCRWCLGGDEWQSKTRC